MAKFTAKEIAALTAPGRYHDGGGLYVQVRGESNRSWLYRYTLHGKAREMGLGPAVERASPDGLTLAQAREKAADARKLLSQGIDPLDERKAAQRAQIAATAAKRAAEETQTFEAAAAQYIAAHEASWRNPKHRQQWRNTLDTYVLPAIGKLTAAEVGQPDVLRVLSPIWRDKPETAGRVRGRIEAVLDYAKAIGWRSGENPARWRGNLEHALPMRRKLPKGKVRHHPALDWREMGEFMAALRTQGGTAARALEFVILTAARISEVLNMTWRELDLDGAVWSVPAARMKGGRDHRVPLSEPALAVLRAMVPPAVESEKPDSQVSSEPKPDAFVFPGWRDGRPLSLMAIAMLLRRMNEGEKPRWIDLQGAPIVAHGFRSTFRDWAGETTHYARETVESALAHVLKDKTEAAYARGDQFAKRALLMTDWARWCAKTDTAEVVALADRRTAAAS